MNVIINDKKIKMPLFIKIILLSLLILLVFLLKYKISLYDILDAKIIKIEEDYYVQVFVPMAKQDFIHDKYIIVDNKEYEYKVENIANEYVFYNNMNYMIVNISSNLDKSYNIENNYFKIKQLRKKETLFNILVNKIKKGMNL